MRSFSYSEKFMMMFTGGKGGTPLPQEPAGYTFKGESYSPDDFTIVTGDKISGWDDLSTFGNDLDQPTAINQPTYVEYDLVTQYTASNQPKLVDTGGGVTALEFGDSQYLDKLPLSDSFTLEITDIRWNNAGGGILSSETTSCRLTRSTNTYNLVTDLGNVFNLGSYIHADGSSFKLVKDGNSMELFEDGIKQNTVDLTGETLSLSRLSRVMGNFQGTISSVKFWNSADSSGEPNFTLDASDITKFRTSANEQALIGDDVAKWYANEHNPRDSRVRTTSTQYMNGYPTYAGDQSHVVMTGYDTLGTVKKDISSSTTQAWLGANANDLYQAVADDGTVYEFAEYAVTTDDRQLVWVIDGNDLKLYVNSWLSSTKDVTGKTFTLDRYGASADSTTGDTEVKNGYPEALSQDDVKYWSYLRDANGNILVDSEGNPLLPSEPPSA